MATYGSGQMLGSGINPESFKQDYSGFTRAAEMQAQGIASLGQNISGAIEDYGKMKKQQQEDERAVQKSKNVAKAIGDLIPDLKPTIQNSLTILDNKELPLSQRKAEAEAISDILNLGIGEIRNRQDIRLKKRGLKIQENEVAARGSSTERSVNLQQGEITETIGGKQYKIPVTFNPSNGETRRLDGTIVGAAAQTTRGIDAALNLPIPALTGNLDKDATAINNAQQLPSVNEQDNTSAIILTGGMPDGQDGLTNVAPMPVGSPTTTEIPRVDGLPQSMTEQPVALPPGAVPLDVKEEKALSEADRIRVGLPPGNYIATFTGNVPSNIRHIPSTPDSMEKLKENRMLKADERITNVLVSTDQGAERLIGMNEALALLNSGEVKSGAFKNYKVAAARIFGMDVASEEQFNSLVGGLAMEAIDLTKGAISDREMTFFREELAPGLNKSVEGNKRILEFKIKAAKRGLRINQVAREMLSRNELPDKIEAEIKKIQNEDSLVSKDTSTSSKPSGSNNIYEKYGVK